MVGVVPPFFFAFRSIHTFARMDISWFHVLVLLLLGVVAGFVNTVSAAGSLVSITALMFTGLSGTEANASNRVAVLAQNFSSTYTFLRKGYKTDAYLIWLSLASVPGAVLGALFSIRIPEELFVKILSGVMLLFLVLTVFNPLKNATGSTERLDARSKVAGVFLFFLFGIYGGFIQAGSGFFLMAGCQLLHRFPFAKANFYKAFIMSSYALAAFLLFVFNGNIRWVHGLLMAVGMSAGGYAGVRWSIGASEAQIRRVIVVMILCMVAYLWFFR